ncbi:hypothetical protein LZ198_05600 [Myxococcus sp. K15C18031901]|uniref:hypothetical protein n=1 Tax=Myxococcus dinghuensis TaxID=2906761 RepID=UPI0020A76829|nr:hypothetical protein [Myxococcus dinghuensis]MCP3098353.1 hypothetical protein [Myxococcus dinghuensis]
MLSALPVVAALALSSPSTLGGGPVALEPFAGRLVACTEQGLEVLTKRGHAERVVSLDGESPGGACVALERVGARLFVATGEGIVALDAAFQVEPVLDVAWHALPDAEDASEGEYVERLELLARALPPDATYTVLTSRYAGTADGRVLELGTERVWSVPGMVTALAEARQGLQVESEAGAFLIDTTGRLASR